MDSKGQIMAIVGGVSSFRQELVEMRHFLFSHNYVRRAILPHCTPRTNEYFKNKNPRREEKEREEEEMEPADKAKNH